jgi:hypothetical protein
MDRQTDKQIKRPQGRRTQKKLNIDTKKKEKKGFFQFLFKYILHKVLL